MHKSPTEVLRLGATPDAGPRSSCALRRAVTETCASSRWQRNLSTLFAASSGEPGLDRTAQSCARCTGFDQQAGGPELHDWVMNKNEVAPEAWFPGVLQQLWIDVGVRGPHAERYSESASQPGVAAIVGETEKTKRYGMPVRALVFETYGRLRDLVTTAAANGQCSPHAAGRWRTQLERVLLSTQTDTYLRALGSRVAERPAVEPPLLQAEQSVYSSVSGGACIATLM